MEGYRFRAGARWVWNWGPIDFEWGAIDLDWGPMDFECGDIDFEGRAIDYGLGPPWFGTGAL